MKRLLIISNGPVPPMVHAKIEGGGQRCWGLATGLHKNGWDVTVAVRDSYPLTGIDSAEGIHLTAWSPGKGLAAFANRFDMVIISYSMGATAARLAKHLRRSVTLVLDCYVPIYIEASARGTNNLPRDYVNYMVDLDYFNTALRRGDYFLCANEPQKHLYTGALSALGIINPYTYREQRILTVPFGVDSGTVRATRNPYRELGIPKGDFILLWFGGLYPWFDIIPLLKAVKTVRTNGRFHLVIVGGKHPYNTNPDFTKQYDTAVAFAQTHELSGKTLHFVDWIDFADRINWYKHADAAISINNPGEESNYSWRTRVMDHVWGGVPLITNGGDPLSELLLAQYAAIQLPSLRERDIIKTLSTITTNTASLMSTAKKLQHVRQSFYWEKVTAPITEAVRHQPLPYRQERTFRRGLSRKLLAAKTAATPSGKLLLLPRRVLRKLHGTTVR